VKSKLTKIEGKIGISSVNFELLIVEKFLVLIDYCEFGNLKSYLIKNRNQYINQLNGSGEMQPVYKTAEIDTIAK
jgi:hypothetical protein